MCKTKAKLDPYEQVAELVEQALAGKITMEEGDRLARAIMRKIPMKVRLKVGRSTPGGRPL